MIVQRSLIKTIVTAVRGVAAGTPSKRLNSRCFARLIEGWWFADAIFFRKDGDYLARLSSLASSPSSCFSRRGATLRKTRFSVL